jgi:hypothetical protein
MTSTYVIYLPLSGKRHAPVSWRQLTSDFGMRLIRERNTQATVEADPREIDRLREAHPELGVTPLVTYHKLTAG